MWTIILPYRLLSLTTNSTESLQEAAAYFRCAPEAITVPQDPNRAIVGIYGLLKQEDNGGWYVRQASGDTPLAIQPNIVGLRETDRAFPVYILASIPLQQASDENFDDFDQEDGEPFEAILVASEERYHLVSSPKTLDLKVKALEQLYSFPVDHQAVIVRFLSDEVFALSMACCLGFLATAKVENNPFGERSDELVEIYNQLCASTGRAHLQVDSFAVLGFLDLVGDVLGLSYNSITSLLPPGWLNYLCAWAVSTKLSVWETPRATLAQMLLKEVPSRLCIPVWMLVWILGSHTQGKLVKDLLNNKKAAGKRKEKVRTLLFHFAAYASLDSTQVQKICRYLCLEGLTTHEVEMLMAGKCATAVRCFLRDEYHMEEPTSPHP